jgi:two-component system nitrogen regulation response regulator NtrX
MDEATPERETVMVVDDEAGVRTSLSGFLKDNDYRCVAVSSVAEALEELERKQIHLALVDVWLPGENGIDLLEQMKSRWPDTAVIVMSGNATVDLAVKATKLGAYDFLEKPIDPEKLLITMRRSLEMERLKDETSMLRAEGLTPILGESRAMAKLMEEIARVAPSSAKVLIMGENGTGKELIARAIHEASPRAGGPYVKLNCAAIPHDLVESELFGHEKGAFTGAQGLKKGKLELAHGGTLFLDEIGDMSPDTQAKFLRAIETGELERVGGTKTIKFDTRIVAATNKDLTKQIEKGDFREDLYYRLNVVPLRVPPLREREGDIALLSAHFLKALSAENGRPVKKLSDGALALLSAYRWPGNVRELRNFIERVVIMVEKDRLTENDLLALEPGLASAKTGGDAAAKGVLRSRLEEEEERSVREALDTAGWNVSEAARRLGIDRASLHRKIKRYGLERQKG